MRGRDGLNKVIDLAKSLLTPSDLQLIDFTRISFEKADPAFTSSLKFGEIVKDALLTIKRDPVNIFVHIKDFLTHLKVGVNVITLERIIQVQQSPPIATTFKVDFRLRLS